MENNTTVEKNAHQEDNSSAIFGTSSDAIVQGLHNGAFTEQEDATGQLNPKDDAIIVNEQEQNEIVNPDEEEFTEKTLEKAPVATTKENQGISDDVIEGDAIDDGIDNEDDPLQAKS